MSPSTRSKSESESSPPTGDAEAAPSAGREVAIQLEMSRQRIAGWAVFGTIIGVLLIVEMGTVAVWGGFVLVAIGLFRAYQLVQTFLRPAGTIVVSDKEVSLPRGLHTTRPLVVAPKAVTAVYFLRRSVPWNRSAPVLIIEVGDKAMVFPRDWFASEADQRHVVHALLAQRDAAPA
jgi:hypothetical protein